MIALFISPTTSLNSTPNECMFNKSALVEEQRTRKREKSWKTTLVRKEKILHDQKKCPFNERKAAVGTFDNKAKNVMINLDYLF